MTRRIRPAFTLFQLLVVLALLALLFALLLPVIAKVRAQAVRAQKLNNLKQIALACHNYADTIGNLPPGNNANGFSASAHLLPYIEQDNLYKLIDFKKPSTDKANAQARGVAIKVFLSPQDPVMSVETNAGATNYLYSAGTKPSLKGNDGVFFQDSKIRFPADIPDGTSNTLLVGETLKGDGGKKAADVKRQHVLLDIKALDGLNDESGVEQFKENKHIASDRCASWMDGRFLQGTFTATRSLNDAKPDVSCGGDGGLSALRSLDDQVSVAMCDGSARLVDAKKVSLQTWKLLAGRNDGQPIPEF
jgi:type II secretory pathway pseudopilin PulG